MASIPHVVIVEDDPEIAKLVSKYLSANECRVTCARNAREMDRILSVSRVSLMVLDINLPGEDGLSICRRLQSDGPSIPIIMLTAKGEEVDRVIGLEMGADDYLPKPFSPRELLARVRAVLRRKNESSPLVDLEPRVFCFEGWKLNASVRQLLSPQDAKIAMTGAEFDLLHAFCKRPRRILSRDQLLDLTQGRFGGPFERSVDILVSRLRQKIERDPKDPQLIKTVRSGGYLFSPQVERI
jgi:two-component system OmpR family response regulator